MPCDTVDVVVVGDGPAGAMAALVAIRHGARVVLAGPPASRQATAHRRIETVGHAVLQMSEWIGVTDCFSAARAGLAGTFLRNGQPANLEGADDHAVGDSWHVDRAALDMALRAHVVASGVEMQGLRLLAVAPGRDMVRCEFADGRVIRCGLLIDATGRSRSAIPRRRELLSPPLLALTGLVADRRDGAGRTITRFDSDAWGWLWQTSNCGAGYGWTALLGADLSCPPPLAAMKRQSIAGSLMQCAATWQVNLQRHPRILPVGDASGSLDPASGCGLANVLATAGLTASVVQCLGSAPSALEEAAATFHDSRITLLLGQADALSRHYADLRILQPPPEPAVSVPILSGHTC